MKEKYLPKGKIDMETIIYFAQLLKAIRTFLENQGFIEVLTPILHKRPDYPPEAHFVLNSGTMLRICMELRLRQVLALGLKSVYEIGPCFRKEKEKRDEFNAFNIKSNEFYLMECFKSQGKLKEMISLTEQLVMYCVKALNLKVDIPEPPWPRISIIDNLFTMEEIEKMKMGCSYSHSLFIEYFDRELAKIVQTIKNPAFFLVDYPVETISIAKRQKNRPYLIERFEAYINKVEIAHGFVDSIDPQDVFLRMRELGWYDEALIALLTQKVLPPSSGVGIGIERLLQVLLDKKDITEVRVPEKIRI